MNKTQQGIPLGINKIIFWVKLMSGKYKGEKLRELTVYYYYQTKNNAYI